jgi:hypothetical protein
MILLLSSASSSELAGFVLSPSPVAVICKASRDGRTSEVQATLFGCASSRNEALAFSAQVFECVPSLHAARRQLLVCVLLELLESVLGGESKDRGKESAVAEIRPSGSTEPPVESSGGNSK